MKIFTNKNMMQKIIIAMIFVIFFNFAIPNTSNAAGFGGKLFTSIIQLVGGVGDIGVGLLHKSILGTESAYGSVMLDESDVTVKQMKTEAEGADGSKVHKIDPDSLDQGVFTWDEAHEDLEYPNMLYTPEAIFSNKIATLDVNFINPNKYTAVNSSDSAKAAAESIASTLQPTIATWYNAFKNIALVGLLSVLVYIGIRIVLSSTSSEKAKYKERIMDWVVAICLLFVMHYIMSFTLVITEEVTKMFSSTVDEGIIVQIGDDEETRFKTNFMGYIRFMTQSDTVQDVAIYTILYLVLVIYTFMFTITYLKRVLYMAFFTMIAPLVALTYPLDKISDGKSQAFNMWLKEYIFNAIIQPVHLMLYIVLIGSSISLCASNPIYALVVLGFLLPAEKFIKKMFGFNKAEMTSGLGAVAGGALAMSAIKRLSKPPKLSGGKSNGGSSGSNEDTGSSRGKSDRYKNYDPYEAISGETKDKTGVQDKDGNKSNIKNGETQRLGEEDYSVQKANELGIEGTDKQEQLRQAIDIEEQQSTSSSNSYATRLALIQKEDEMPTFRQKVGKVARGTIRGVAAVGGKQLRQAGQRFTPKNIAKFAGRNAARAGLAALGGTALGVAGLAAGIATGDFEKAVQYGATGVGAGAGLGISAREKMAGAISNNSGTFTQAYYGKDYKKHKQKEYDENFKTNEKNIQKLQEYCNSKGKNWKEVMQSQQMQSYLDADITDIKDIITGMKLEDSTGITTDRAIASYKLANQTSNSILTDNNKLQNFKQTLLDSGISEKEAERTISQVKYWKDK